MKNRNGRFICLIAGIMLIGLTGCQTWHDMLLYGLQNPLAAQEITAAPTAVIVFYTVQGAITPTPFQPQPFTATVTQSPTPSATPTPSPTPTSLPTLTPSATLPETVLLNVTGFLPAYSLNCEARSAVDWAAYFGVSIGEGEFFAALPTSDNPDKGFVGNVHDPWGMLPPNSYGVHAKPVAKVLQKFGLEAQAVRGLTWDQLRTEIAARRPVITWVIGRVWQSTPSAYTSLDGHETIVAPYEHTVIVIGYSEYSVTVLDGALVYEKSIEDFLGSWSVLGNMAVLEQP